jgi:hypothetical protein
MVKLDSSDVIQMSKKSKQTPMQLVVPDLDFVIISSRYEERLRIVKMYTANRSIVLVEAIDESSHPEVPELDHTTVETC